MFNVRGFVFSVDMVYGAIVVVLLFSLLIHASKPMYSPAQQLLQIQAKDAVVAWFYGGPDGSSSCSASLKSCACDIGFRPLVTTTPLDPTDQFDWAVQTVCVESP